MRKKKKDAKEKRHKRKKVREKKDSLNDFFIIIIAYWINIGSIFNIGSRGWTVITAGLKNYKLH